MMKPLLRGLWVLVLGFTCFAVSDAFSPRAESSPARRSGAATSYFTEEIYSVPPALQKRLNAVFAIDFNHDGFQDLIALQTDMTPVPGPHLPAPILAYTNDGHGHFIESTASVLGKVFGTGSECYRVADFTGDGLDDVFIADLGSEGQANYGEGKGYHFLIQKPNGTLVDESATRLPVFNGDPYWAVEGDVDMDGDLDVVVTSAGGPNYVLLINNGQGYFKDETARLPVAKPNWIPNNCLMLDVNKDGSPDIFMGEAGGVYPQDFVFVNDGTGHFTYGPDTTIPRHLLGQGAGTTSAFKGDFDGDGWMDLAFCCLNNPAMRIQLLYNKSDGSFRDVSARVISSWPVIRMADFGRRIGDVNGDGWPDILAEREVWPGSNAVLLLINQAGSSFEDVTGTIWPFHEVKGGEPPSGEFVDIDNDGDLDVIGTYPASDGISNQIYVLVNQTPYPIPEAPLPYPGATTLRSPADGALLALNKISFGWDAVPTAFAYRLQLAKESTFTQILSNREVTTNSWPGTGMAPKTTVYWRVRAINSRGAGPWSSGRYFITAFPVFPPTNAKVERIAVDYGFFKVYTNRLTWQANSQNSIDIRHYRIYRKAKDAAESAWSLFVDLPGSSTTYDDRGLRKDQLFTYRITTVSSQGFESDPAAIGN